MITVGTVLYGHCDGHFGRDHYGRYRIEALGGDWIVCRKIDIAYAAHSDVSFATFRGPDQMYPLLEKWSSDKARERWQADNEEESE